MKGKGMSMKKHGYSCMGCLSKASMEVHGGGRRRAGHEDADGMKYFDAMVGKCLPAGKRKCAKGLMAMASKMESMHEKGGHRRREGHEAALAAASEQLSAALSAAGASGDQAKDALAAAMG